MKITMKSLIAENRYVDVDPYALNPIGEDAMQYASAIGWQLKGSAPKMFNGGLDDLPPFTASGVEPEALLKLPALARHHAAALTTIPAFYNTVQVYADFPEAMLGHAGLADAIRRCHDWLMGKFDGPQLVSPRSIPAASRPVAQLAQDYRLNGVTPAVAALANELGVVIRDVRATGCGGRVTSEDVKRSAEVAAMLRAVPATGSHGVTERSDDENYSVLFGQEA